MPRKVKTAFTGTPTTTARSRASTTSRSSPRERDGVRGFEMRVGGGTSIMPRIAPTLYDFVEADNGDYLKVAEAVLRIFDRQDWLRVNRARARIKVLRRQVRHRRAPPAGRRGARGRLGRRARLRPRRRCCFDDDEEAEAPRRRPRPSARRTATSREFERFRASNVVAAAPGGLQRRPDQGVPRRPDARAVPRPRRRSCATSRGGYARTTVHQNLVLRWVRDEAVYDVWQRLRRARPRRRPAPTRSPTSSAAPAPTAASSASRARWASTRAIRERLARWTSTDPLTPAHPHQDERLPERLLAAPHREHRVLRRVDQGRRAHDPGLRRPHRRQLRGRRGRLRRAPEGAPPAKRVPDAVERWMRMYEAERTEGEAFNAFADRVGTERFEEEVERPRAAGRVRPRDHEHVHRLERNAPFEVVSAARASARSERRARASPSPRAGRRAPPPEPRACCAPSRRRSRCSSTSSCGSRRDARVVTIDTGVLFPETLRDVEALRGPLRRPGRGRGRATGRPVDRARALLRAAKVAALERALAGADAWITGIRREQAPTRATRRAGRVGREARRSGSSTRSRVWTEKDVWQLHPRARPALPPAPRPAATRRSAARRAPSRAPAARAAGPGSDKTECGLHVV